MYDILSLGSATVDVFAHTTSQLVKFITSTSEKDLIAYPSGSKILVSSLQFSVGGGGTNTAASFAKLGLKTGYIGKIGSDENGSKVLELLSSQGVDFLGSQKGQTGYSIILDSLEHDRTILTYKGVNNHLRFDELDISRLSSKWLYISSMMAESYQTAIQLAQILFSQGTKIAFNPSNYQAQEGYAALQEILDICEVLVLNKEEAQNLLSVTGNLQEVTTSLGLKGIPYVVVTDGKNGICCYHDGNVYTITSTPNHVVVESTGAGDAFASTFVASFLQFAEDDLPAHLIRGMKQAEAVISVAGAKEGLCSFEELAERKFGGSVTLEKAQHPALSSSLSLEASDPFVFKNGKEITSLEELAYYLKFISQELFSYHVNEQENHFVAWIEHACQLPDLAREIQLITDKYELSKRLLEYTHKR